jgi:hypothetical protein
MEEHDEGCCREAQQIDPDVTMRNSQPSAAPDRRPEIARHLTRRGAQKETALFVN